MIAGKKQKKVALREFLTEINNPPKMKEELSIAEKLKLASVIRISNNEDKRMIRPLKFWNSTELICPFSQGNIYELIKLHQVNLLNISDKSSLDAFCYNVVTECHISSYEPNNVVFEINIYEIDDLFIQSIILPSYLKMNKNEYRDMALKILVGIELELLLSYVEEYNLSWELSEKEYMIISDMLSRNSINSVHNAICSAGKFVMSEIMANRTTVSNSHIYILNVAKKYLSNHSRKNYQNKYIEGREQSAMERVFFENYLGFRGSIYEFDQSLFFGI